MLFLFNFEKLEPSHVSFLKKYYVQITRTHKTKHKQHYFSNKSTITLKPLSWLSLEWTSDPILNISININSSSCDKHPAKSWQIKVKRSSSIVLTLEMMKGRYRARFLFLLEQRRRIEVDHIEKPRGCSCTKFLRTRSTHSQIWEKLPKWMILWKRSKRTRAIRCRFCCRGDRNSDTKVLIICSLGRKSLTR